MKELTWTEIITGLKGPKTLREENKLNIPIEYINSTRKYAYYFMGCFFVVGFVLGYTVKGVLL